MQLIIPPLGGEGRLRRGGSKHSNGNITVNGSLPITPSTPFASTVKFCLLNFKACSPTPALREELLVFQQTLTYSTDLIGNDLFCPHFSFFNIFGNGSTHSKDFCARGLSPGLGDLLSHPKDSYFQTIIISFFNKYLLFPV